MIAAVAWFVFGAWIGSGVGVGVACIRADRAAVRDLVVAGRWVVLEAEDITRKAAVK